MILRMWINQPSDLQPYHKWHGQNILFDSLTQRGYFLDGPVTSLHITGRELSPGWRYLPMHNHTLDYLSQSIQRGWGCYDSTKLTASQRTQEIKFLESFQTFYMSVSKSKPPEWTDRALDFLYKQQEKTNEDNRNGNADCCTSASHCLCKPEGRQRCETCRTPDSLHSCRP